MLYLMCVVAVKVADKMQKELTGKRSEVDTLRSKTRWLEDKLESVQRVQYLNSFLLGNLSNNFLPHNEEGVDVKFTWKYYFVI